MSKTVNTSWDCPACGLSNHTQITKPAYFKPTVTRRACEECGSTFLFSFTKVPREHSVAYRVINFTLTEAAKLKMELQKTLKSSTATGVAKQEETTI